MFGRIAVPGIVGLAVGLTAVAGAQTLTPYYLDSSSLYIQQGMQRSMLSNSMFNSTAANEMMKKGGKKRSAKRARTHARGKAHRRHGAKGSASRMSRSHRRAAR